MNEHPGRLLLLSNSRNFGGGYLDHAEEWIRAFLGDQLRRALFIPYAGVTVSWDDYAAWHLGLTDGATDQTKGRYAFVTGDLRRVHRSAIIACHFRAAEWRHKAVELAAHDLLQVLDRKAGIA